MKHNFLLNVFSTAISDNSEKPDTKNVKKILPLPRIELRFLRPQRSVLTTILQRLVDICYMRLSYRSIMEEINKIRNKTTKSLCNVLG